MRLLRVDTFQVLHGELVDRAGGMLGAGLPATRAASQCRG